MNIKKILTGLMAIVAVMIGIVGYGYRSATKLPDNTPESFLVSEKRAGEP